MAITIQSLRHQRRPRVLLVDNYPDLLTALERLLTPSCDVVGLLGDSAALLDSATRLRPDVIIVDLMMPSIDGLEACRRIRHAQPHTKVILMTAADDASVRDEAIRSGASAFVLKFRITHDLLPAIHAAVLGEFDGSPSARERSLAHRSA